MSFICAPKEKWNLLDQESVLWFCMQEAWGPAAGIAQKQKLCTLSRNSLDIYCMIVGIKYL